MRFDEIISNFRKGNYNVIWYKHIQNDLYRLTKFKPNGEIEWQIIKKITKGENNGIIPKSEK